MPDWSRYDRLRRRIAPVAFLLALGFLVHQTCQSEERQQTTIVLDFGDAAPRVKAVRADVFSDDGEPVAWFERAAPPDASGRVSFPAMLDGPSTLRLRVDTATGLVPLERRLRSDGGDTLVVDVGRDLP
jgi:hypothetical protein